MKKSIAILWLFVFALLTGCAAKKTNETIITETDIEFTETDIEFVSWAFDKKRVGYADYSLFTLTPAAAARNPRLNDLINTLLYEGQTAREYVEEERQMWEEYLTQGTTYKIRPYKMAYVGGSHEICHTWEMRGKYLLLKEEERGGGGSSYEYIESYIIDTALVKRLTIDDIIIVSELFEFLWSRMLAQAQADDWPLELDIFYRTLEKRSFAILFEGSNIVFRWDEGSLAANAFGAFEVSFQRSELLPYLTNTGREIVDGF